MEGNVNKALALLEGGWGADRVDSGPRVGLSCAWLLQGWA